MDFDSFSFQHIPSAALVVPIEVTSQLPAGTRRSLADRLASPPAVFEEANDVQMADESVHEDEASAHDEPSMEHEPTLDKRISSPQQHLHTLPPRSPSPQQIPPSAPVALPLQTETEPAQPNEPSFSTARRHMMMIFGDLYNEVNEISSEWASHSDQLKTVQLLPTEEPASKRQKITHSSRPDGITTFSLLSGSSTVPAQPLPTPPTGLFSGLAAAGKKRTFEQMQTDGHSASTVGTAVAAGSAAARNTSRSQSAASDADLSCQNGPFQTGPEPVPTNLPFNAQPSSASSTLLPSKTTAPVSAYHSANQATAPVTPASNSVVAPADTPLLARAEDIVVKPEPVEPELLSISQLKDPKQVQKAQSSQMRKSQVKVKIEPQTACVHPTSPNELSATAVEADLTSHSEKERLKQQILAREHQSQTAVTQSVSGARSTALPSRKVSNLLHASLPPKRTNMLAPGFPSSSVILVGSSSAGNVRHSAVPPARSELSTPNVEIKTPTSGMETSPQSSLSESGTPLQLPVASAVTPSVSLPSLQPVSTGTPAPSTVATPTPTSAVFPPSPQSDMGLPLPPGWLRRTSRYDAAVYYFHPSTKRTQWRHPAANSRGAQTQPVAATPDIPQVVAASGVPQTSETAQRQPHQPPPQLGSIASTTGSERQPPTKIDRKRNTYRAPSSDSEESLVTKSTIQATAPAEQVRTPGLPSLPSTAAPQSIAYTHASAAVAVIRARRVSTSQLAPPAALPARPRGPPVPHHKSASPPPLEPAPKIVSKQPASNPTVASVPPTSSTARTAAKVSPSSTSLPTISLARAAAAQSPQVNASSSKLSLLERMAGGHDTGSEPTAATGAGRSNLFERLDTAGAKRGRAEFEHSEPQYGHGQPKKRRETSVASSVSSGSGTNDNKQSDSLFSRVNVKPADALSSRITLANGVAHANWETSPKNRLKRKVENIIDEDIHMDNAYYDSRQTQPALFSKSTLEQRMSGGDERHASPSSESSGTYYGNAASSSILNEAPTFDGSGVAGGYLFGEVEQHDHDNDWEHQPPLWQPRNQSRGARGGAQGRSRGKSRGRGGAGRGAAPSDARSGVSGGNRAAAPAGGRGKAKLKDRIAQ